jgi:hypothetical protein
MIITICSAFRQATGHLSRYFAQVEALQKLLTQRGDLLNLVLGYGDSTDGTAEWLFDYCSYSIGAHLINCHHNGPRWASVEHPDRFKQLAYVANKIWANIPPDADVVVFLDGDLIWEAATLLALIDHTGTYPAVAPMVMHLPGYERYGPGHIPYFYDCYAFRRNGVRFTNRPPYHADVPGATMLQLDSAGACMAMRGDLARAVRFPETDVIVGMCRQIYERGDSVFMDCRLRVYHP